MTSDHALQVVLEELAAPAQGERPDWNDVLRRAHADVPRVRRRPRILLAGVAAVVAAAAVGAALAAGDLFQGPPAPPENDAALRGLMPPLRIGAATELASHGGRTLFGARTAGGGYCFSSTSPLDRRGEGGHCLSEADASRLDERRVVAFALSGSSVGGYAPGAVSVSITGAGIDVEIPVSVTGWWVGEARLPTPPVLPEGVERVTVAATAEAADGAIIGRDPLLVVERVEGAAGAVYRIAFA